MSEIVCPQCGNPCEQAHKFCPVCGFPVAELSRKTDDPLIGTTLPGGYVILDLVGVGGMGRVYRAEQKALGRTVAVKIIHPHLLGDESASVRFITEARASSRLNHPNSVSVIDFGKNGGQLYLVMEFLRGRDLARVLYEDGPLPFKRIAEVMIQVLAALAEAHHLDIIHRDLKPENIVLEPMRTGGDFVKVVDFGLAKMKADITSSNVTSPGIVCGTPDYMAPEQGRGDAIDARSDLYACGVILYQCLTGRLPFEAESPTQVVLMHLSLPPPDPATIAPERDIPEMLIDVTMRALEKDPGKRFQTADEFAQALREAITSLDTGSGRFTVDAGILCASCGAVVPKGQKFCGDCGARVNTNAAPTSLRARKSNFTKPRDSSLPRLPVPFTAREEDLDWLAACRVEVDASVSSARVIADHGVGKTRLLQEFLHAAAQEGDVIVHVGPDPWWAEVGNYTLRKAICALAGLPADGGGTADWAAATPEARRGLADIFHGNRRGGGKVDMPRDSVRPHIWTKAPAGTLTPEEKRFIAAEALRWAMLRAHQNAEKSRVILAVDDLHAVDGSSRNAFSDVIAEPPLAPMLIVAAHVPGFEPGWRGGAVKNLGGLPTSVAASLVKGSGPPRTQGNEGRTVPPLYIDQLIRFNLEGGGDPPARMADLIALRIERLPIDARRTLQAVAVLGDATDRAGLGALLPELNGFDDLLSTLSISGLLVETIDGIRISHPLVRDVTLAAIPAGVRRELHAEAHSLAPGPNGPLPIEVQALHAYHAQNSFEALMLLEQVADRAASRDDQHGCVLALRRGLDLSRREIFRGELDDPMRAVLIFCRKLGDALARAGDLTDADGVLREALDLAGPNGPDRAVVLASLAFVSRERARTSEASVYLREALELARQTTAPELVQSLEKLRREWMTRS